MISNNMKCMTRMKQYESIYTGKINIDEVEMDQSNLLKNLV